MAQGTSTSPASGNTATLIQAAELVLAIFGWASTTATISNPVTGYANLVQADHLTGDINVAIADKTVSATTAQSAGGTLSASVPWGAICLTFKNTGAAPVFVDTTNYWGGFFGPGSKF